MIHFNIDTDVSVTISFKGKWQINQILQTALLGKMGLRPKEYQECWSS